MLCAARIFCQEPECQIHSYFLNSPSIIPAKTSKVPFCGVQLVSALPPLCPPLHQKHHLHVDLLINVNKEISTGYFLIHNSFAQSLNGKHKIFNY